MADNIEQPGYTEQQNGPEGYNGPDAPIGNTTSSGGATPEPGGGGGDLDFERALTRIKGRGNVTRRSWGLDQSGKPLRWIQMYQAGKTRIYLQVQEGYATMYSISTEDTLASDWIAVD